MTVAEIVLQTTNDDQVQSEVAPSIALQESDTPQKERINLTGNEGIKSDIPNSDTVINDDIGLQIKDEALEGLHTPKQVSEQININQVNTTPIQRNLQHM